MSLSANVRSVQALEDLKGALARFGADAQTALGAAAIEIQRALEWLTERQRHWQGEVRRRDEAVARARAALAACLASGNRDHPPNCGAYQAALVQAQWRLREGQEELRKVKQWSAAIHDALAGYRREARRLDAQLGGDLPRASALLGRKIATLHDYAAISPPSGGGLPAASSAFPVVSPAGAARGLDGGAAGVASGLPGSGVGRGDAERPPAPTDPMTAGAAESVRDVPLDEIDVSDTPIRDVADFHKVSHDEVLAGFRKLEDVVRPAVRQGADGDHFARLDAERGLAYEHGYRRVYDAFYGDDSIRLERVGDGYRVVNGYHRLFVARELGLATVPARVVGL